MATSTFHTHDGLEFSAVIEAPQLSRRNGWGVLLIGGGLGNDLDWTVPGAIGDGETRVQMTISGESHADGPAISAAFAARGFTVMRWSTIAVGDLLADQWPMRATPRPLAELLEQTREALAALSASDLVRDDHIILLGHSLGAARACTVAANDLSVRGLILLAPAHFTQAGQALRSFEEQGMRYGEDVLRTRAIPCLAVFGGLDSSRVVDAPAVLRLTNDGLIPSLTVCLLPDLGHQLGQFVEWRHGPVDPGALRLIGDWAEGLIDRR